MLKDGVAQYGAKVDVFETAFGDIMAVNGIPSTVKAMFDEQLGRFAASVGEIFQDVKKTIKAEQKAANKALRRNHSIRNDRRLPRMQRGTGH